MRDAEIVKTRASCAFGRRSGRAATARNVRPTGFRCPGVWLCVLCATCTLLNFGCEATRPGGRKEIDVQRAKTRDDITQVHTFFTNDPWIRDNDGFVVGIKSVLYLQSAETELGAFGPGEIIVALYRMEPSSNRRRERKLVKEWRLDEKAAEVWRVRYKSAMGFYYGFPTFWPEDVDLSGALIELQFSYVRLDSRLVQGDAKRFRVPVGAENLRLAPPTKSAPSGTASGASQARAATPKSGATGPGR